MRAEGRLPPGQSASIKWPVLHEGAPPRFDPAAWDFKAGGLVEAPLRLTWPGMLALPRTTRTSDFHCVTKWSTFDNRWEGVAIREILYGFAPLHLHLGRAPLIATIIWGLSIYAAIVFAEEVTGEPARRRIPSAKTLGAVALFMIALAGFYEPFLARVGMARWQEGTRATLGVPWIALVGYPTLAVGFLLLWGWVARRAKSLRFAILVLGIPALAIGHAFGLQALKDSLGW